MKDHELTKLDSWRFVNIKKGEKVPIGMNWQKNPHQLTQIYTENIGVILGPASQGLCAIDFDGEDAIDHFYKTFQNIDITSIDTVMWTSGKPFRFQAAFTIPEEYWSVLKRKVVSSLEFRWTNTQSVLPPSTLNDGRTYVWLKSPSQYKVQPLPEEILTYWLKLMLDEYPVSEPGEQYVPKSVSGEEANKLAEELKQLYPTLVYDDWIRVTWAFCHAVGDIDGLTIMRYYYPETKKGEYNKLLRSRTTGKVCTIGTVIKMINDRKPKKTQSIKSLIYNFNRK